jgi:uncharacterized protein (DUF4415 family)
MTKKTRKERNLEEFPEPGDWSGAVQGPLAPLEPGKTQISIRIDTDVLDCFREQVTRAGGGSYQSNMNAVLRAYVLGKKGGPFDLIASLREVIRETVREELRARTKRGAS